MFKGPGRCGLALIAALALMALSPSLAAATNFTFEKSPAFLTGEQTGTSTFTVNGGSIKCKKATTKSGEIVGTSVASIEVSPSYSECTAFGQEASVNTGTCKYKLTASSVTSGAAQMICGAGSEIVVTAKTAGCTVKIKGQTPTTPTVDYQNLGSGTERHVLVSPTVAGITYTSSGGICGASGVNGTYAGSTDVDAWINAFYIIYMAFLLS